MGARRRSTVVLGGIGQAVSVGGPSANRGPSQNITLDLDPLDGGLQWDLEFRRADVAARPQ